MKTFICFLTLISFLSCSKDKSTCWEVWPTAGYYRGQECGKTQRELEQEFAGNPMAFYYRSSEPRFCWRITQSGYPDIYRRDFAESAVNFFYRQNGFTATKLDCNSFCGWKLEWKRQQKITGYSSPTIIIQELNYTADTCSKLYLGKQFIKDLPDSIYTYTYIEKLY